MSNIETLKTFMGVGLGLRKNKFLIELPIPGVDGEKIDVLVKSASLPERKISQSKIMHQGRSYNIRGETEYPGTYTVTFIDDSEMTIRKKIDKWLTQIDDSAKTTSKTGVASYESATTTLLNMIQTGQSTMNNANNSSLDPLGATGGILSSLFGPAKTSPNSEYQIDMNIWQLSADGLKVYGYKLQNAFPISIGSVSLDDSEQNTLTEFNVDFAYSEFIPLEGVPPFVRLINGMARSIQSGINKI